MVLLEQFTFRFVEVEGALDSIVVSSTSASGPIDLDIDRKLQAAEFSATVGGQRCMRVDDDFDCTETTVDLDASWSADGEVVRFNEHTTPTGGFGPPFLIVHEQGKVRNASASVGGTSVPGDLVLAELFDRSRSFILVCRGGPNVDPADCPAP